MSAIEVLVACMNRTDDSLYREMNLSTDAILANQCEKFGYEEYKQPDGSTVKLISSSDRGVGRNRNKALLYATGEYLLLADEDMIYNDDYKTTVLQAFETAGDADIIVFNLEFLNRFTPEKKEGTKFKRIHLWNSMRYGAPRIAIKRSALEKHCLSFSHLYGGGAKYSSGEDSLFIREALRKGLKMYTCPIVIAQVKQEESSWFKGYNDKFFIDKGVLIANAFPCLKSLFLYYFAYGLRKVSKDYGFRKICRLMRQGIREYKNL